jgi:transposase
MTSAHTGSMSDAPSFGFSARDRQRLAHTMKEARDARLFRRLQAVLRVAEGRGVTEAARLAGVDRTSVSRWVAAYRERHRVEDLADLPRAGRPRAADDLDDELLAEALALDPRTVGYHATSWTVALLATYLCEEYGCVVSPHTLRRRLREFDWRWKRPRYVYHERAPHVAQKKGQLSAA